MGIKLKQKGGWYGNRYTKKLPNLKVGEFRYYIQDNPNIITGKSVLMKVEFFKDLFEKLFPDYEVIIEKYYPMQNNDHYFYKMVKIIETANPNSTTAPVDNKSYICFREAKHGIPGLLFYWHDAKVYIYQEKFVRKKNATKQKK